MMVTVFFKEDRLESKNWRFRQFPTLDEAQEWAKMKKKKCRWFYHRHTTHAISTDGNIVEDIVLWYATPYRLFFKVFHNSKVSTNSFGYWKDYIILNTNSVTSINGVSIDLEKTLDRYHSL